MEAFIPRKKGCLLNCLDWIPNRGACIDACLSCDVTRSFRFHDIKLLDYIMMSETTNSTSVLEICHNLYTTDSVA